MVKSFNVRRQNGFQRKDVAPVKTSAAKRRRRRRRFRFKGVIVENDAKKTWAQGYKTFKAVISQCL